MNKYSKQRTKYEVERFCDCNDGSYAQFVMLKNPIFPSLLSY